MKIILKFLILISLIINFSNAAFLGVDFSQNDKKLHFAGSYILSSTVFPIINEKIFNYKCTSKLKCGLLTFSETITIGVLKEIADSKGWLKNTSISSTEKFDNKDLKADILGALLGSFAYIEIKF